MILESGDSLGAELLRLSSHSAGLLTLDRFLECALYHPKFGYYGRKSVFGRGGDYQTAPRVHPIFGWTVAREVESEWIRQGKPEIFTLLEIGPGEGHLTKAVVEFLAGTAQLNLVPWRFFLMDRFPREEVLATLPRGIDARWVTLLSDCQPFHGVVLANEVLDAIPFHSLLYHQGEWTERYVRVAVEEASTSEGTPGRLRLSWETGPLSRGELIDSLPGNPEEGSVAEVSEGFRPLFSELSRVLQEGLALFFDYGDTRENIQVRRPEGTMETFHQHSAGADPFVRVGETDVGCWVDFTHATREAESAGFTAEALISQAEALTEWGLEDLVRDAECRDRVEGVRARLAMKTFHFSYSNHRVLRLRMTRRSRISRLTARDR